MKKLFNKNGKKGFTLAELLIVVAIIGVLVAIAIPIFSAQLEKSRENTDIANLRAAKAAAVAMYLDDNESAGTYKFDAQKGVLVASTEDVNGYGKGTTKDGGCEEFYMSSTENYAGDTDASGKFIQVVITDSADTTSEADIALSWVAVTP